jgi:hypothetical protein
MDLLLKYSYPTTIQPNTPRINQSTLYTVKFIKTVSFGCEIQSLIAVLTVYAAFHAISTPSVMFLYLYRKLSALPSIPCEGYSFGTIWRRRIGVFMETSMVDSRGKVECVHQQSVIWFGS